MRLFLLLFIFINSLIANQLQDTISKKTDEVINDIQTTKKPFNFFVKGTIVNSDYTTGDTSASPYEVINKPLYSITVGATFLPDTLDITASYSTQTQNEPQDWYNETDYHDRGNARNSSYLYFFMKPFKYIGFAYEDYQYETLVKNNTDNVLYITDQANDGNNPTYDAGTQPWEQSYHDKFLVLNPGETFSMDSYERKFTISFHAGKEFKYMPMPDYFVGKFSYVDGQAILPATSYSFNAKSKFSGWGGGMGIEKTLDELKQGFNLKKMFVYGFAGIFPFSTQIIDRDGIKTDIGGGRLGIEAEVAYLVHKNFYVLAGVDYQNIEMESYDDTKNKLVVYEDTNMVSKFELLYRF